MPASKSGSCGLWRDRRSLAHKMIFPALYAMVKARGTLRRLAFPKWTLQRLQKMSEPDSIEQSGGIDNKQALHHLLSLLNSKWGL